MFHKYLLLGQKNSVGAGTERGRESRLREDEEKGKQEGWRKGWRKEGYTIIHHAQARQQHPRAAPVSHMYILTKFIF